MLAAEWCSATRKYGSIATLARHWSSTDCSILLTEIVLLAANMFRSIGWVRLVDRVDGIPYVCHIALTQLAPPDIVESCAQVLDTLRTYVAWRIPRLHIQHQDSLSRAMVIHMQHPQRLRHIPWTMTWRPLDTRCGSQQRRATCEFVSS